MLQRARALLLRPVAVGAVLSLVGLLPPGAPLVAQQACSAPRRVTTAPARPVAGTLFELRVFVDGDSAGRRYEGTVAGERVHFRQRGDTLIARAAIPVDSTAGVTMSMRCIDSADQPHQYAEHVGAVDGGYRMERLTVAPRFSAPPDSALAERMRREAERAANVSRAAHDTPQLWDRPFLAPRTSRITSGFGTGRTFNGQVTSRHMGTDYAGAVGAPVRAINRGIVRIVDAFYLGGNVVYLDHGAGMVSAYLHLSRTLVAAGDTVARGAVIGHVGATGRVTGPHLHLITRYGNISVDALSVIGTP